jgi:hypothetical protein
VRLLFLDPVMRSLHTEWEADPGDPGLAALVGELSVQDPDFRTWWGTHQVAATSFGTKSFRHSVVGDLILDCDTWDDGLVLGVASRRV